MKLILLLTGTVKPENMILTKLMDPAIRKEQYLRALDFWLTKTSIRIVFVENSGVNLSSYFQDEIASKRLEILTFKDNTSPRELGKGFGEINCMLYAHTVSRFIKDADFIFKVTGRLKIMNFESFLNRLASNEIDVSADLSNNLNFSDSRFWGYRPAFFYEHLFGFRNLLNDSKGIFFEHILAKAILQSLRKGGTFLPFRTRLRVQGVSGTSNKSYGSLFAVWYLRNLIKKVKHKLLVRSLSKLYRNKATIKWQEWLGA
jgi:hypothetical protein